MGFKSTFKNLSDKIFIPGSFVQNVAFSLSGNTFVLVIGFLLTPIVARVYGPVVYGEFALFTAISSLIQPISTLQLQAGYVAASDEDQFAALVKVSLLTLFFFTLLTLAGIMAYYNVVSTPIFSLQLGYLLPLYVFLAGVFNIFRGWNIKIEEFKRSAQSKVGATLMGKSATIGYGLMLSQSALGMVVGGLITFIFETLGYFSKAMYESVKKVFKLHTSFQKLKRTLYEFGSYPKYVTTNSVINNFGLQVPIYFIAAWYSTEQVGLLTLSLSLITVPVNLLSISIGAVFLPKISSLINNKEEMNYKIKNLYQMVFYPGLFGLFILSVALNQLLPIILGNEWQGSAQLSSLIAFSFVFSIPAHSLSVTYRFIRLERINLLITIIFVVLKILGLGVGYYVGGFIFSVMGYLLVSMLHRMIQILVLFNKLEIDTKIIYRDLIFALFIFFVAYWTIFQT